MSIYDPMKERFGNDISYLLLNISSVECTNDMRIEAGLLISRLRSCIQQLIPENGSGYQTLKGKFSSEELGMIYWDEHVARERARAKAKAKAEVDAIGWIGA